jgi:hypothetical protein
MVDVQYVRDVQYSFDRREGFFVENGGDLTYTQRVGGPFDLQGRVSRYSLNYDASEITMPRTEVLWSYQGGIGYSLESGSRFGLSYEIADRDSTVPDRTFARRRLFGSFTYEFWK